MHQKFERMDRVNSIVFAVSILVLVLCLIYFVVEVLRFRRFKRVRGSTETLTPEYLAFLREGISERMDETKKTAKELFYEKQRFMEDYYKKGFITKKQLDKHRMEMTEAFGPMM